MPEQQQQFDPNVIQNAIQFWHKLNTETNPVRIKFKKKDGSTRFMRCTLNFQKIPEIDKPKKVDIPKILKLMQNSGILHVYDVEKRGWRSVPFNNIEYLQAGGRTYKIQPIKKLGAKNER